MAAARPGLSTIKSPPSSRLNADQLQARINELNRAACECIDEAKHAGASAKGIGALERELMYPIECLQDDWAMLVCLAPAKRSRTLWRVK